MTDTNEPKALKGFIAHEPVMAAAITTWLLTNIGLIIVGHTHAVTADQWGAVATYLTPIISAAILGGIGTVVRQYVTPAWKWLETHVELGQIGSTPIEGSTMVQTDVDNLPPLD